MLASAFWSRSSRRPLPELEEVVAVAVLARDRLGHGTERLVHLALELEADRQDLDLQRLPFVISREDRARRRQAAVDRKGQRPRRCALGGVGSGRRQPWRRQAQVGVVRQFGGAAAGAFGQVALGTGL